MTDRQRVLIIGLDGATLDLLQPLMDQGEMPMLKSLVARGVHARLTSAIPPVTAPAWVTFQTGVNPGKHGLVDFMQPDQNYHSQLVTATDVTSKSIWNILSEAGKTVVTINVPLTYPPRPVNGYMVSGMLAPNTDVEFTYPRDLAAELLAAVPGYQIMPLQNVAYVGLDRFVASMIDIENKRAQAAVYLLRRVDWDVCMVHFQATDVLQHAIWSHLDPAHSRYASIPAAERDRAREFYRRLDQQIAKIIAEVGEDTDILVMSDHGFGPAYDRLYINQWLTDHGFLSLTIAPLALKGLGVLEDVVRRVDILKLRRRIMPAFGARDQMLRGLTQDRFIDWGRSHAFAFSGGHFANVYLNRRDRFAQGRLSADQADRLREEIAAALLTWKHPVTGQTLIERVYRREEVYSGPQLSRLPDLIVRPRAGYIFETRFKRGWLIGPVPADLTGVHRMEGVFVGAGPRFTVKAETGGASLIDVPATVLYLFGIPIPQEMDGRVLTDFLRPDYVTAHAVIGDRSTVLAERAPDDLTYTFEEEQIIKEHLSKLGYL